MYVHGDIRHLEIERKAELRGQGYKILDAVFKPEQEVTVKRNARSNDQPKE